MEQLFVCCPSGACVCRARQDKTRQDKTRQTLQSARHDASSARRYYHHHHDHDAVRLTLQPDRRACEPDPEPKPEAKPEPGRRRQTRARHSINDNIKRRSEWYHCCKRQNQQQQQQHRVRRALCSAVLSRLVPQLRYQAPPRQRDKLTKTVGAQRGPRGGICAPCLSSPHSSACDKWDVYGQWNACPVLLVLHRKASGRTFSRTQTSCCTCCPEQPSVQPPHLQSSRWALTAASPSPHASATTRLAGFGCCSAVCLTSGHDPFWRNLCGHPSQVCSQCRTTSATCQSLSSHSVERIHGSERRGGLS